MTNNYDSLLQELRIQVDAKLDEILPKNEKLLYSALFSSARYSLLSPGKRLRPLLLLAVTSAHHISIESALIPACAIEMIHTYSLIHDDLPCMDDDDLRRGVPTLHKVYPEWQALLTGDYLLTHAFELLAESPHLSVEQRLALVMHCAKGSGAHGMIGGQMIDLLSENRAINYPTLEMMHHLKTAALINAALQCGATIASLSPRDCTLLKEAAEKIGIAFQLIDDVLDDEGDTQELGKSTGSDRNNHKSTAVSLLGNQQAKEKAYTLLCETTQLLQNLSTPLPLLNHLFEKMVNRSK